MQSPMVSIYNGVKDTQGFIVSLDSVIQRIRSGAKGLDEKTKMCNILARTDKDAYAREKILLPAFTPSGSFRKRESTELIQHSGKVILDFDDQDIPSLKAELAQEPSVELFFVSPSGNSGKILVPISPIPTSPDEHRYAFYTVLEAFSHIGYLNDDRGNQCDVNRLCLLAFDPDALYNPSATPIEWDIDEYHEQLAREETQQAERQSRTFTGDADLEALDHVPSDAYDTWYKVGLAIYRQGLAIDVWVQWSETSEKAANNSQEMYRSKWASFQHDRDKGVTWGTVLHLARLNGYKPKRNHKPVKLRKRTDLECVIEPIEKAREALRQAFGRGEKLIGFRADTGIGKTHEAIKLYQIKGVGGFISTPTTDLAKEVKARLDTAEVIVFRWRGIHAEPDGQFPHEKPCMFPDEYKAYAESGRNAYKMLCEHCQFRTECEQDGYRSQETKAKAAQVTVAAHKDLLFNPLFRSTADRLLPKHKDDLIVIDEFNVFESFIEIKVAQARLEYLRDTWHDHPLGEFAKDLLNACVVQNAPHTSITDILNTMSGIDRSAIIEALASYRIGEKIYTRKEAHEIPADMRQSVEIIESLPKIETESWNLLIQLEIFISRYHHAAGAPIEWKDNTLTFYLPPLPLYTEAKVLCMSATLNQAFFEKVFEARQKKRSDVGFIDADDTEWHPEAKVYQLRTNRNPRSTLLTAEKDEKGKWHYTGFTATGQKEYDSVLKCVKANPQYPHALISYKWVIETHADELKEANIITGHYGGLVGLDTHFGGDTDTPIVLHILGAPEVPPYETERRFQLLYGDRETPADFTRDNTTGEYHDKDVQAVYEAGVKSELMQGIGRAGLVKNASTVILRTSLDLPSVSHREQTQHFDEVDWAHAEGNLDALPEVVAQREAREAAEAEAIAVGDVQAVMETKGVAKSQAYKLTKATRSQQTASEKADREAKIIALHHDGHSQLEIERQLKIIGYTTGTSPKTIRTVLKDAVQGGQDSTPLYSNLIERVEKRPPPENPDATGIASETLHTRKPDTPPIPISDYPRLDLDTARQELERCQQRMNYSGAAFLRSHIQKKERQLTATKKGATMDYYNILTVPPHELFTKMRQINAIANDNTSPEQETAIDALSNLSNLLEKRFGSRDDIQVAPGHLLTFGTMPDRDIHPPNE